LAEAQSIVRREHQSARPTGKLVRPDPTKEAPPVLTGATMSELLDKLAVDGVIQAAIEDMLSHLRGRRDLDGLIETLTVKDQDDLFRVVSTVVPRLEKARRRRWHH
jgi:hypothetical protein